MKFNSQRMIQTYIGLGYGCLTDQLRGDTASSSFSSLHCSHRILKMHLELEAPLSFSMRHHLLLGVCWLNTTGHCTTPRRYFQEYKKNVKNIRSILLLMHVTSH